MIGGPGARLARQKFTLHFSEFFHRAIERNVAEQHAVRRVTGIDCFDHRANQSRGITRLFTGRPTHLVAALTCGVRIISDS